jgi:hypothetical protein
MEVKFAESFFESLESTFNKSWIGKVYDWFKYDLRYGIQNFFYFWKVIWKFRSYDNSFTQNIFAKALDRQAKYMEINSNEVDESLTPKIQMMKKVVNNFKRLEADSFIEEAETELGNLVHFDIQFEEVDINGETMYQMKDLLTEEESAHNSKIYRRSSVLEQECWEETWEIIKGHHREMGEDGRWNETPQDGTNMQGWWY